MLCHPCADLRLHAYDLAVAVLSVLPCSGLDLKVQKLMRQGVPGQGLSDSVRKYRQSVFKLNYKIKKRKAAPEPEQDPLDTPEVMPLIPSTAAARMAAPEEANDMQPGVADESLWVAHTPGKAQASAAGPELGLWQTDVQTPRAGMPDLIPQAGDAVMEATQAPREGEQACQAAASMSLEEHLAERAGGVSSVLTAGQTPAADATEAQMICDL